VKPWLEQAEVKMAVGLTKPLGLDHAKKVLQELQQFKKEADDIEAQISAIEKMSAKIKCKTSAANEMDALR
jgi:hypothetical protein